MFKTILKILFCFAIFTLIAIKAETTPTFPVLILPPMPVNPTPPPPGMPAAYPINRLVN
jgi:hypothetical protein